MKMVESDPGGLMYIQANRDESKFYHYMGWFFGSRQVAKDLGMPMYDDPNREWIIVLHKDKQIAVSSIEFLKSDKAVMKSGWVDERWRNQGIYDKMILLRLDIAKERKVKSIRCTATEKSRKALLRHGFKKIGMKGRYYVLKKEMGENV